MDLKNFEGTTTYAIEAVYREYWNLIPERYKLFEKAQIQDSNKQVSTPLTYADVDKKEHDYDEKTDTYLDYVDNLNDKARYFDLQPYFDPELNFENRTQYKLVGVNYPQRKHPWFIITWNFGSGNVNNSLTRRRFLTCDDYTPDGTHVRFKFMNTELNLTMAVTSNTLQGLVELQENIMIGKREKAVVNARNHSILGEFPVSLDLINSSISKLSRDKGTLCVLTLEVKISYVIIGALEILGDGGIIKEIHLEVDKYDNVGEGNHTMLGTNIIKEEDEEETEDEETEEEDSGDDTDYGEYPDNPSEVNEDYS